MHKLVSKLIIIAVIIGIVAFILTFFIQPQTTQTHSTQPTVTINNKTFVVELADMPEKQELGLSGHKPLRENEGMLFLFDSKNIYTFWMKDMLFPIDMIWIADETVVDVTHSAPAPSNANANLPLYQPKAAANRVLEIAAGMAQKHGIVEGSQVIYTNLE